MPLPDTSRLNPADERGYALAALLVTLGVSAVLLLTVLPLWAHQAQREKEAELVFRGEQYARAIRLYARDTNGALPPRLDALVSRRYLRRRYADPMAPDGLFVPISGKGGIAGVTSSSTRSSIRIYKGGRRYSEWRFVGKQ